MKWYMSALQPGLATHQIFVLVLSVLCPPDKHSQSRREAEEEPHQASLYLRMRSAAMVSSAGPS